MEENQITPNIIVEEKAKESASEPKEDLMENKDDQSRPNKKSNFNQKNCLIMILVMFGVAIIIIFALATTAMVIAVIVLTRPATPESQLQESLSCSCEPTDKYQAFQLELSVLENNISILALEHQRDTAEVRHYITTIAENLTAQQQNIRVLISAQEDIYFRISSLQEALANVSDRVDDRITELNRTQAAEDILSPNISLISLYEDGALNLTLLLNHVQMLEDRTISVNNTLSLRLDSLTTETQTNISQLSASVQSSISQLEVRQNSTTTRLDTTEEETFRLHRDVATMKVNLSAAMEKISQLDRDTGMVRRDVDAVTGNISQLERDRDTTTRNLGNAVDNITQLQTDQQMVNNRVDDIVNRTDQLGVEQASLGEKLNLHDTQLNDFEKRIEIVEGLSIGAIVLGVIILIAVFVIIGCCCKYRK